MDLNTLLFLLSFPLSILANLSTDYIKSKIPSFDDYPLQDIFTRAFLNSLKHNKQGVDLQGQQAIARVETSIRRNKEKLFFILESFINNEGIEGEFTLDNIKIESLSELICQEFDLKNQQLAKSVVRDCLMNYQIAFYSELTEKEGIHVVINCIKKINSEIAKKEDLEKLRKQILDSLSNPKFEQRLLSKEFIEFIREEIKINDSNYFSTSIVNYFSTLKKKIQKLTEDQYQVIHHLRFNNRVMISGCAGSGKTLLVAEKAIRLDEAGISTLILCHNPHLANHIKNLVNTESISVIDFTTLIYSLISKQSYDIAQWNEYIEPMDSEIELALDEILHSKMAYEAIIIDEGQDFRDNWWIITDALQENSKNKILYIFYDDNQSLLPLRSIYPLEQSPHSMSKNCRNGGKIFEVVKKFHPNAPLTSQFLSNDGIVVITPYNDNEIEIKLESAMQDLISRTEFVHQCVITNESDCATSSINQFQFIPNSNLSWRNNIYKDLNAAKNSRLAEIARINNTFGVDEIYYRYPFLPKEKLDNFFLLPKLSVNVIPTKMDIKNVCDFANRMKSIILEYPDVNNSHNTYFAVKQGRLYVFEDVFHPDRKIRRLHASLESKINFYTTPYWSSSLPIEKITNRIVPFSEYTSEKNTIPLYTLDQYKGLECDGILFFINSFNYNLEKELYVGSSRAIGYLNIVINKTVLAKIKKLNEQI